MPKKYVLTLLVGAGICGATAVALVGFPNQPLSKSVDDGFVTIPGGTYEVGCDEAGQNCEEVTVEEFEISKYELTFDEWDECYEAGGCHHFPEDEGHGRGNRAVVDVSLADAFEYSTWKRSLGDHVRVPTINEFLAVKPNITSDDICEQAHVGYTFPCEQAVGFSVKPGSYPTDYYGLYDVVGNVAEWTSSVSLEKGVGGVEQYEIVHSSFLSRFSNTNDYQVRPSARAEHARFRGNTV